MDFDNYESDVNPCKTCKHYRSNESSNCGSSASIWGMLFIVALFACGVLFTYWQADEAKLKNCIYLDDNGGVHSIRDGQDWTMFDADYLRDIILNEDSMDY